MKWSIDSSNDSVAPTSRESMIRDPDAYPVTPPHQGLCGDAVHGNGDLSDSSLLGGNDKIC